MITITTSITIWKVQDFDYLSNGLIILISARRLLVFLLGIPIGVLFHFVDETIDLILRNQKQYKLIKWEGIELVYSSLKNQVGSKCMVHLCC